MGSEKESARHWYVVHTYSGYENKVLESLKQKVQSMGLENEIFDVIIPEKEIMFLGAFFSLVRRCFV